jgi:hypothetical protein
MVGVITNFPRFASLGLTVGLPFFLLSTWSKTIIYEIPVATILAYKCWFRSPWRFRDGLGSLGVQLFAPSAYSILVSDLSLRISKIQTTVFPFFPANPLPNFVSIDSLGLTAPSRWAREIHNSFVEEMLFDQISDAAKKKIEETARNTAKKVMEDGITKTLASVWEYIKNTLYVMGLMGTVTGVALLSYKLNRWIPEYADSKKNDCTEEQK